MAGWKYPYKTKPYEHQRKALKESADRTTYALFMELEYLRVEPKKLLVGFEIRVLEI